MEDFWKGLLCIYQYRRSSLCSSQSRVFTSPWASSQPCHDVPENLCCFAIMFFTVSLAHAQLAFSWKTRIPSRSTCENNVQCGNIVTQKALTEADSRSAVNLPLHCEWPPSLCPRDLACGKHGQRHGAFHCQHGVPDPDVDLRLNRDHGAAKQKRREWRTSGDREMHGNRWSSWCSAGMLLLSQTAMPRWR